VNQHLITDDSLLTVSINLLLETTSYSPSIVYLADLMATWLLLLGCIFLDHPHRRLAAGHCQPIMSSADMLAGDTRWWLVTLTLALPARHEEHHARTYSDASWLAS
jgi:hypothetical protein